MARGTQEREQQFIRTAKTETGQTIEEWMDIVKSAGLAPKNQTILKHLKANHKLNHMQANFIAGIYLNNGQPVYDYDILFATLTDGKDHLLPVYENLKQQVVVRYDDVVFIPTKGYVSIEGEKIFGCAKFTTKAIRYGLDLGDTPQEGIIQKAKGLGAMPNITHMIELRSADDITDELLQLTDIAFNRVH